MVFALIVAVEARGSAQPREVVLEGRVVGPDGRPVADPVVVGTLEREHQASTFRVDTIAPDGTFVMRMVKSGSPVRRIRVLASAPGFSDAREVTTSPKGTAGYAPVVLALRPTIDFTVNVVDWDRKLVRTATVAIGTDSSSTRYAPLGVPHAVDATGAVTFRGLNDRDSITLHVEAPGYLGVTWQSPDLAKPLEVQIARGGTLRARMVDATTGAAVSDCKVVGTYLDDVSTDRRGGFSLRVPYGRIGLEPDCDGYGRDHDAGEHHIDFTEVTASRVHVVRVRRVRAVRVRVVDARGRPVSNTLVRRTHVSPTPSLGVRRHGPPTEVETTDARGEVVFARSSMQRFRIGVDGAPSTDRELRVSDLRGTVVLRLP